MVNFKKKNYYRKMKKLKKYQKKLKQIIKEKFLVKKIFQKLLKSTKEKSLKKYRNNN